MRPVILAGGQGSRLRPRTLVIPKPLLPVLGTPLLTHIAHALRDARLDVPMIALDYASHIFRAFYAEDRFSFHEYPRSGNIAEMVLDLNDAHLDEVYLVLSGDLLLLPAAVSEAVDLFRTHGHDCVLLAETRSRRKNWSYKIDGDQIVDIVPQPTVTALEAVATVLTKRTLREACRNLRRPLTPETLPVDLQRLPIGRVTLLKAAINNNFRIRCAVSRFPICPVNLQDDFLAAEHFLRENRASDWTVC